MPAAAGKKEKVTAAASSTWSGRAKLRVGRMGAELLRSWGGAIGVGKPARVGGGPTAGGVAGVPIFSRRGGGKALPGRGGGGRGSAWGVGGGGGRLERSTGLGGGGRLLDGEGGGGSVEEGVLGLEPALPPFTVVGEVGSRE